MVSDFALRRLRSPKELAEARALLRHAGFTQCDACSAWHNEHQRADAHGSAWDKRCAFCGAPPVRD